MFPTRSASCRKYRRYLVFILLFSTTASFVFPPILPYGKKETGNTAARSNSQQLERRKGSLNTRNIPGFPGPSFVPETSISDHFRKEPRIEVFILPFSKGSLAVIEPLCYHEGSWIVIGDASIQLKHSLSIQNTNKKASLETLLRESKLPNITFYSLSWLQEESSRGTISWIERSTILQLFDRSCTNIAHFAGRLMLYFHFLQNVDHYYPTKSFASIFIRESELVQNLLTKSYQNHRKWQKQLIGTVLYNKKFEEDLFDYPSKYSIPNELRHFNEREFYVEDSSDFFRRTNKTVCFDRVVLLGLLKGKFFSSPTEPANNVNFQGKTTFPTVPRDAIEFRNNWYKYWNLKPPHELKRRLIYIKREGKRRSFSHSSEVNLNSFLEETAKNHGYAYVSLTPDQLLAQETLQLYYSATIVLSLHGAHLTNCIFMVPCAVLIEIFPPRFTHDMYRDGGNSGLKYFSWQLRNVTPFPEESCTNPQMCKSIDEKRKVFYRDRANLTITQEDLNGIANVIKKSMAYIEDVHREFGVHCLPVSPKFS